MSRKHGLVNATRFLRSTLAPGLAVLAGLGFVILILAVTPAIAQNAPPQGGQRGGPPPEALAACDGKPVNTACTMTVPNRSSSVAGTCVSTPENTLARLPDDAPPRQQ